MTTDTTYEAVGKAIALRAGGTYIDMEGDNGGGYESLSLIAGTTSIDGSHASMWLSGSATTSNIIELFVAGKTNDGHISITGGYNQGQDVAINIQSYAPVLILGRPITLNGDTTVSNMQVTGDIYTVPLTDYSSSSVLTGFSSIITKQIHYTKVGKHVDVYWYITGTSNAQDFYFTVPYAAANISPNSFTALCRAVNNGADASAVTAVMVGSAVVIYSDIVANSGFVSSGTKQSGGHITYQTA
jgi:hypothetical protein